MGKTQLEFIRTAAVLALAAGGSLMAQDRPVVKLWPGGAPGEQESYGPERIMPPQGEKKVQRLNGVTDPMITVYRPPAGKANGSAVVICPGGGYSILAYDLEGTEIAEWLNSIGVTGVLLKYRVPRRKHDPDNKLPLQDAQRAIRLTRQNAAAWGVDPKRVGILGFSAGGHLTVMAGTRYGEQTYARVDGADDLSSRPDFLIPIYPAYLGEKETPYQLSEKVKVTKDTPPTFIAVTLDDQDRGAQSALFLVELKKNGVRGELHLFMKGGHGYGLRPSEDPVSGWPQLCERWMRAMGLM